MLSNQLSAMPAAYRTHEARRFARLLRNLRKTRVTHDVLPLLELCFSSTLSTDVIAYHVVAQDFSFTEASSHVEYVVEHLAGSSGGRRWGIWRNVYVRGYATVFGLRVKVFEQLLDDADFRCTATDVSYAHRLLAHAQQLADAMQVKSDLADERGALVSYIALTTYYK
ncbi:hypothetical protein SFSGTM_12970 [Sulfuriferula nivalis]|uniref:Uncharacterized protein n=2 Tax=Sulfuriferula nivalis TaxID=2675298 RepID=A0A809RFI4_9PROT|nr:hypothetical protein SFSGTM_12970 [Sulfuriferula nivalis]